MHGPAHDGRSASSREPAHWRLACNHDGLTEHEEEPGCGCLIHSRDHDVCAPWPQTARRPCPSLSLVRVRRILCDTTVSGGDDDKDMNEDGRLAVCRLYDPSGRQMRREGSAAA